MGRKDVGGQAVIEGVMMRGSKGVSTAIRKANGEIIIKDDDTIPFIKKYPKLDIPFLRGIFALIDSMRIGINSLNYSASVFDEEEEEEEDTSNIAIAITMIISFFFSILIFVGIPTIITNQFKKIGTPIICLHIIEAIIRITILLLYMWAIGKMKDIYRVFQYHGAEHKTIFCYESGEDLTVENVRKQSRLHPRCGTNFLFLVMFVGIFIFIFTGWGNFIQRMILRIILLPVISGVSYEIIKWLGRNDGKLSKIIAAPGLKLQLLTTNEPDDDQIEVAIAALMASEGLEKELTIQELVNLGTEELKGLETPRLDAQLLLGNVLEKDKLYLLTHNEEKVSTSDKHKYLRLIEKRKEKMPIKYILKTCEFMGMDLYVEEGVLIPRNDTEVLVEEVLKKIEDNKKIEICDLCCGSGAIGIALANFKKDVLVDSIDYYEKPEKVTKINIKNHELEKRVRFIKSDLLSKVIEENKKYDIIVSNPPYIEKEEINNLMEDVKNYEPSEALDGGEDGLDFYKKIIEQSKKVLKNKGILSFEIGYNQGNEVKKLMLDSGYENIEVIKDLAGLDRVVIGNIA